MLTDAQIKEISLLRSYASRLDTFKDVILVGCGALLLKAESVKDDLQNISNRLDYDVRYSNNQADYVIRRYEEIVDRYQLTSQNSVLLGSTATDAKAKLSQLNNCAEEIKSKIEDLEKEINSLGIFGVLKKGKLTKELDELKVKYANSESTINDFAINTKNIN